MALVSMLAGCRKEDLLDVTAAASAAKGIPVLSEIWKNGVLEQKNYYENGRLVRISWPSGQFPREHQYSYRDKDHYVVMTGDYMYYHYYFNEAHQLIRADVADFSGSENEVWVRHEFAYERDRVKSHSWMTGDFVRGNFSGSLVIYDFKGMNTGTTNEYEVAYTNGVKTLEQWTRSYSFTWHTPFEYRFGTDRNNYNSTIYSNTIRTASYNTVGFPWGYYSIEDLNKHELMSRHFSSGWIGGSGMLELERRVVTNGDIQINEQVKNLVVNKDKLPVSYDVFNYPYNTRVHYEYKYVVL